MEQLSHDASISGLKLSRDEGLILTWSCDSTARLWHTNNGTPTAQLMKHEGPVSRAVFSRDGSLILTWSDDGTARLWHIDSDYDFPKEYLPLLVEVLTGTYMDDVGIVNVLSKKQWEESKKKYIEIASEHLKTCQYKNANMYLKQMLNV